MDLLLGVEDAADIFVHSTNTGLRAVALFCSSRNSLNDLWSRLAGTNSAWFVSWMSLAILADLIQVFVGAMRWKEISALCGASLGLTRAFGYN